MKISIITINYNNLVGLQRTASSVINQTYKEIEYILIDGGSGDGCKEYIERISDQITQWRSESDKGIYHAMNKGIQLAKGEYLLFLNSGDYFKDHKVLMNCQKELDGTDFIYGDVVWTANVISNYPSKLKFSFLSKRSLPHQGTFIKRTLFDQFGLYDESLRIVSDWKFFLLGICKYNASYKKINQIISVREPGGISDGVDSGMADLLYQEKRNILLQEFSAFMDDYDMYFKYEKLINFFSWVGLKQKLRARFSRSTVVK